MKKIIIVFIFFNSFLMNSQSKKEIAGVYFNKAEKAMEGLNYELAKIHFAKGIGYLDSITSAKIALNGTLIYYELKEFEKAKEYAKQFFVVSRSKKSDSYLEMLNLYVEIEEEILKKSAEEKRVVAEKFKKEKASIKMDSLKSEWEIKEAKFTLVLDTLTSFNKNGIAIYAKGEYYGLINDKGVKIIEENTYKKIIENEGYFLLLNKKELPTKIVSFNSITEKIVEFPEPFIFDENLSNYGFVTVPRENGHVIIYSEEISKTILYDLKEERVVKVINLKEQLKALKKNNKIDKFDFKKSIIKVNKIWYRLGAYLGGGVYSLYEEESNVLFGFIFTVNQEEKAIVKAISETGFLSAFCNNKLKGTRKNKDVWFTKEGDKGGKPQFNNKYKGSVKIKRITKGKYQLTKDGIVFLEEKTLEKMADFIKKHTIK